MLIIDLSWKNFNLIYSEIPPFIFPQGGNDKKPLPLWGKVWVGGFDNKIQISLFW
jgi:hypothetical protein